MEITVTTLFDSRLLQAHKHLVTALKLLITLYGVTGYMASTFERSVMSIFGRCNLSIPLLEGLLYHKCVLPQTDHHIESIIIAIKSFL